MSKRGTSLFDGPTMALVPSLRVPVNFVVMASGLQRKCASYSLLMMHGSANTLFQSYLDKGLEDVTNSNCVSNNGPETEGNDVELHQHAHPRAK